MPVTRTASDVASRIQAALGPSRAADRDYGLQAGHVDIVVTGIATAWTPSLDVLRRAVAAGANMIVTRECAVEDLVTADRAKGMILLGPAVSEEPGSGAMAESLKTIVTEVPVRFLPAGEPFWMPKTTSAGHAAPAGRV